VLEAGLARAYSEAKGGLRDPNGDGLGRRLAELCRRGRDAHPSLRLDDEAFAAALGRCGAPVEDSLQDVHAEDLYLACACVAGDATAIALLRETFSPGVIQRLKRVGGSEAIREEVEQRLWDALLVGGNEGPKLATYAGRGPLGGWLGISAQRIALMMLRHEKAEGRARSQLAAHARLTEGDPELAAIRRRYRAQFQEALDAAIDMLDDRAKTIYRMRLVEGVTLERIATAYGVKHPTILRWLDQAQASIVAEAKRRLRESLPVTSAEFDSITRLLVSELDLNISRVLSKSR
jgi:RNA polymerase sigma-70 factor (ECF subfamily)